MTIDNPRNPQELTPAQMAALVALLQPDRVEALTNAADNFNAGRRWAFRLFKILVTLGALIGSITAILHGFGAFQAWRSGH